MANCLTENAKQVPDVEKVSGQKGIELSMTPIELKSGDWILKVVPWVGGRIFSMVHLPSGNYGFYFPFTKLLCNHYFRELN